MNSVPCASNGGQTPRQAQDSNPSFNYFANFSYSDNTSTINTPASTGYYNYSSKGYILNATAPYPSSANLTSVVLDVADFFFTNATLTVFGVLPAQTSLQLYLSTDDFLTSVPATNATLASFTTYGREMSYLVTLASSNTAVTPVVTAIMLNASGSPYNATQFSCTAHFAANSTANEEESASLGTMNFVFQSANIGYAAKLKYSILAVDTLQDYVTGEIIISNASEDFVTNQNNNVNYDLAATINCVNYRFYTLASFDTGPISGGQLGDIVLFNFTVSHADGELICINSTLTFHLWNAAGGDLSASVAFSTNLNHYTPGGGIPGPGVILLSAMAAVGAGIVIRSKKFHADLPRSR